MSDDDYDNTFGLYATLAETGDRIWGCGKAIGLNDWVRMRADRLLPE